MIPITDQEKLKPYRDNTYALIERQEEPIDMLTLIATGELNILTNIAPGMVAFVIKAQKLQIARVYKPNGRLIDDNVTNTIKHYNIYQTYALVPIKEKDENAIVEKCKTNQAEFYAELFANMHNDKAVFVSSFSKVNLKQ